MQRKGYYTAELGMNHHHQIFTVKNICSIIPFSTKLGILMFLHLIFVLDRSPAADVPPASGGRVG